MNAKKFLAQPENLLNLSFIFLIAGQVGNVVDALGKGRGFLTGIHISLLAGLILITLGYVIHRKRHPYPVKPEGAQIMFLCATLSLLF